MGEARTKRTPVSAQIELTRRCNLSCVHCYVPPSTRHFSLPKETALRIMRELAEMGCLFLSFTGGEALLHPDFPQIYLEAVRLGFSISIFTNASAVSAELLTLLCRYRPRKLCVSVYGSSAEMYQRVCGLGAAYDSMTSAVDALVRAGVNVELRMLVLTLNATDFTAVKQWSLEHAGTFDYDFKILPRLDGDTSPLNYRLTPEQVVPLEVADGKAVLWEDLLQKDPGKNTECGGGRFSCFVTATGYLQTCAFAADGQPLGTQSVASAWTQVTACSLYIGSESPCRTCTISQVCDWCPIWSLREGPSTGPVQYHCDLARLRHDYVRDHKQDVGINAMLVSILSGGYPIVARASGVSMSPWLRPDDSITISPVPRNRELSNGDVVCIRMPRHGFAIHRIIEAAPNRRAFKTKGDANPVADGWVSSARIVGLVEKANDTP